VSDQDVAAEVWASALEHPYGVRIETDDVQRLVAVLYEYKRQSDDPRLLSYTVSQRGSFVLVAKTKVELKTNGEHRPLEV